MVVGVFCVTLTRLASGSESVLTAHRSSPHDRPKMGVGVVGDFDPPHAEQNSIVRIANRPGSPPCLPAPSCRTRDCTVPSVVPHVAALVAAPICVRRNFLCDGANHRRPAFRALVWTLRYVGFGVAIGHVRDSCFSRKSTRSGRLAQKEWIDPTPTPPIRRAESPTPLSASLSWSLREVLKRHCPNHQLLLLKAARQFSGVVAPPFALQRFGHHLHNHDIVTSRPALGVLPGPLCRCPRVRGEATEFVT